MKILIKVLNESQLHSSLNLEGISGKPYVFQWNKLLDSYAYEPKDQEEINDIFATQGVICPWHLSPVIVEGEMSKDSKITIPPFIDRKLYENHTPAELIALASDVGLRLQGKDPASHLVQIDAYMTGRAWGAKHPVELAGGNTELETLRQNAVRDAELITSLRTRSDGADAEIATLRKQLSKAEKAAVQTKTTRTYVRKAKPADPASPETPPESAITETPEVATVDA